MVDEEPNMEKLKEILSLSEDQLRVFNIFHPYALRKIWNAVNKNLRFRALHDGRHGNKNYPQQRGLDAEIQLHE